MVIRHPVHARTHNLAHPHTHIRVQNNMHNRIVVSDTHPMGLHCNILQHILPHAVRNALQHIMQHILQLTRQHRIVMIDTNPVDNDGSIDITSMQTNTLQHALQHTMQHAITQDCYQRHVPSGLQMGR